MSWLLRCLFILLDSLTVPAWQIHRSGREDTAGKQPPGNYRRETHLGGNMDDLAVYLGYFLKLYNFTSFGYAKFRVHVSLV